MRFQDLTEEQIEAAYGKYLYPAILQMCKEAFDGMSISIRPNYSLPEAVLNALKAEHVKSKEKRFTEIS
jgi:hypothetical protein